MSALTRADRSIWSSAGSSDYSVSTRSRCPQPSPRAIPWLPACLSPPGSVTPGSFQHPRANLHLGHKQPRRDPSKLPVAPKEDLKQPVDTSHPASQSLLVPSRWPGQQGDGFLADAVKVFTMETSSPASKTPPKAACAMQRKGDWESSMAPAYKPRKFRSHHHSSKFYQLQAVGNSPFPQERAFPAAVFLGGSILWQPRGGKEPSQGLQHWVHERDQLYNRDNKPSSLPFGNQHPENPQDGGRESKAQPRPPAWRMSSLPPCTAAGSQLLRGFFVLDNKNKTPLSGSYKNPTEKLSPVPSGISEKFLSRWPPAQPRPPGL